MLQNIVTIYNVKCYCINYKLLFHTNSYSIKYYYLFIELSCTFVSLISIRATSYSSVFNISHLRSFRAVISSASYVTDTMRTVALNVD